VVQRSPTIEFDDIPLDEARTMGRGPRMDPVLYQALSTGVQSLSDQAVRMIVPEGTPPTTMKNRILRVSAELKVPVTIRKVSGGLLFWRSTDDDLQQAKEIAQRLQSGRKPRQMTRGNRRRRA
jgi:hypothetical protein